MSIQNISRNILITFIAFLSLVVLAIGGFYLYFEMNLKSQLDSKIQSALKSQTGLEVTYTKTYFSFFDLLKLEPVLTIAKLNVAQSAITIDEIKVSMSFKEILKKKIEIQNITFDRPSMKLYSDAQGVIHVEGIDTDKVLNKLAEAASAQTKELGTEEKVSQTSSNSAPSPIELLDSLKIKEFFIRRAHIFFLPYGMLDPIYFNSLNLNLTDLVIDKFTHDSRANVEIYSDLFIDGDSDINLTGKLGPVKQDFSVMPFTGFLNAKVDFSSLSRETLDLYFGELFRVDVDKNNEFKLKANVDGDLSSSISGNGQAFMTSINFGYDKDHYIEFDSISELGFFIRFDKKPVFKLDIPGTDVNLHAVDDDKDIIGKVHVEKHILMNLLNMNVDFDMNLSADNIEFEPLFHAFVPDQSPPISGKISVDDFQAKTTGITPENQAKNLVASGKVEFNGGNLLLIKDLKNIKNKIASVLPLDTAKLDRALDSRFTQASTEMKITDEVIFLDDIQVISNYAAVTGSGTSTFADELNYMLDIQIKEVGDLGIAVTGTSIKPKYTIRSVNLTNLNSLLKNFDKQDTVTSASTLINQFKETSKTFANAATKSPSTDSEVASTAISKEEIDEAARKLGGAFKGFLNSVKSRAETDLKDNTKQMEDAIKPTDTTAKQEIEPETTEVVDAEATNLQEATESKSKVESVTTEAVSDNDNEGSRTSETEKYDSEPTISDSEAAEDSVE